MNYDECMSNKETKKILTQYLQTVTPVQYTTESEKLKYFGQLNAKYKKKIITDNNIFEHTHVKKVKFNAQLLEYKGNFQIYKKRIRKTPKGHDFDINTYQN